MKSSEGTLLDYLIRVNVHKDTLITAFRDSDGEIVIWQDFKFHIGESIYLSDKNLDQGEKTGKVWRIYRFHLNGFSADKITWAETEREYYRNVKEQYKYKSPLISWAGGVLNLEEVSNLLTSSVYMQLQPGQFDRYFRKFVFGLVMQQQGQEELNVKFYLNDFLKFD